MVDEYSYEYLQKLREASGVSFELPTNDIEWQDNDDADDIDYDLKKASEDAYRKIALDIVDVSSDQLEEQNESKNRLKMIFTIFFIVFIAVQYLVLISFLYIKSFYDRCGLSDTVIVSYITSVFVETIGAIVIMIKYAFDSKQEVNILEILNGVISNYQKFK